MSLYTCGFAYMFSCFWHFSLLPDSVLTVYTSKGVSDKYSDPKTLFTVSKYLPPSVLRSYLGMWSRCLRKNSWLFFQLNQGPVLSLSCVLLFCDPVDCSPPGSSVHGVSRARLLEWVVISFSRGSSWSRDWICTSCMYLVHCRQVLYDWATREAQGPNGSLYFIINS